MLAVREPNMYGTERYYQDSQSIPRGLKTWVLSANALKKS